MNCDWGIKNKIKTLFFTNVLGSTDSKSHEFNASESKFPVKLGFELSKEKSEKKERKVNNFNPNLIPIHPLKSPLLPFNSISNLEQVLVTF